MQNSLQSIKNNENNLRFMNLYEKKIIYGRFKNIDHFHLLVNILTNSS